MMVTRSLLLPFAVTFVLSSVGCGGGGDGTPTDFDDASVMGDQGVFDDSSVEADADVVVDGGPAIALTLDTKAGWGTGTLTVEGFLPCTDVCTYEIPEGDTVTVTALADDGQSFGGWTGLCETEQGDTCTLTLDEPRSAEAYFTGGVAIASRVIGGNGEQGQTHLAALPGGDVIVCAAASTTVPTVDGQVSVAFGIDAFVTRMRADGSLAWVMRTQGAGNEFCHGVTTDDAGDVYVILSFGADVEVGDLSLNSLGGSDPLVAKLDDDGQVVWAVRPAYASAATDNDSALHLHTDGRLYVAGIDSTGSHLVALDTEDGTAESVAIPHSATSLINSIASAPEGQLYIAGSFVGTYGSNTSAGGQDAFLARISTSGAVAWSRRVGGSMTGDVANVVGSDASGRVYVGGSFAGMVTFPTRVAATTSLGMVDWYMVAYDQLGTAQWARTGGGTEFDAVNTIVPNASGESVYVGGVVRGMGTNPVTTQNGVAGKNGPFLVRMASDAGGEFVRTFLGNEHVDFARIALTPTRVVFAGAFNGTSKLGMGADATDHTANGRDIFVHFSGL